jgi:hypothetical protein
MFRPPGLARQAIGILASSRELMNEAQPMRMANGGDVSVSPMPRPMPRPTRDFGEIPNVVRQMPMIGQEEVPYTRQPPDLDYVNALRSESSLYSDIISEFERGKLDAVDTYDVFYHNTMDKIERGIPLSSTGVRIRDGIKNGHLNTNILRITPEMKAKIKKEGLPLFNMGGKVTKRKFMDKPIEGNRREM